MADSAIGAGREAIRRFWRPFVLIQLVAVALVVAYHVDARVRDACVALAAWKIAGGLPLAAVTAAFAGGVLPELAKLVSQRGGARWRGRGGEITFNVVFFAFNGIVVDGLYRGEAVLFGAGTGLGTVVAKTAFDQLVFTPPWLVVITVLYLWRRQGFSFAATRASLGPGFFRAQVWPLLLPDWFFWIPMVSAIYAFPLALQFLLFILALAAWSLILIVIAGAGAGVDVGAGAGVDVGAGAGVDVGAGAPPPESGTLDA